MRLFVLAILIPVLVIMASASATVAALGATLLRHDAVHTYGQGRGTASRALAALLFISLFAVSALASAYYIMNLTVDMSPRAPTARFLEPPMCQISRTQSALVFTDFDEPTFPPPGWAIDGGSWTRDTGHKGRSAVNTVISSSGKGHQLYWTTSISSYSSLWAAVKVRGDPATNYKGVGFLNSGRTSVYEISIYESYLDIWSYVGNWQQHARVNIQGGVVSGQWYTIVTSYTVSGNSITINAWAYRPDGSLGATASATISGNRFFQPAYVGVHSWGPAGPRYDDFVASPTDPRTITFIAPVTVSVQLIDDNGVQEFLGSGTTFSVTVVRDIVLGRGFNTNSVRVYRGNALCGQYQGVVLGSDVFNIYIWSSFTTCPAGTCASATWWVPVSAVVATNISATQPFTGRLIYQEHAGSLASYSVQIRLVGTAPSTPIVISDGTVTSPQTSIVSLRTDSRNYIELTATVTQGAQPLTLRLLLELCPSATDPRGVCLYYPYELVLTP
ncbi:MAG: hypothetical protein ABDH61_00260 [Acidilobaceae archaeon]